MPDNDYIFDLKTGELELSEENLNIMMNQIEQAWNDGKRDCMSYERK